MTTSTRLMLEEEEERGVKGEKVVDEEEAGEETAEEVEKVYIFFTVRTNYPNRRDCTRERWKGNSKDHLLQVPKAR